jgi:proliferating cell nuclear antigen
MRVVISNPKHSSAIGVIFASLKPFTTTIALNITTEGIYIQGMDTSQVCLFECNLGSDWFDSFEVEEEDVERIALSTSIASKVMATRAGNQIVTLEADPDSDKLSISFTGVSDIYDKHFELPLMEIDIDTINVPENDSDVDLVLPSKNFSELISQFEIFDTTLLFTFTEEEIVMKASGDDGSMSTTMKLEDVSEYAIGEGEEVKQSFALRYIKMMAAFGKLANEVSMEFGDDQPLRLKYILSSDDEESYIRFFLAPKINDD